MELWAPPPPLVRILSQVLRWWGFSDDFRNEMIFPLVALFFGTGNQVCSSLSLRMLSCTLSGMWSFMRPSLFRLQTPHVSAAVIARVFLDPQLRHALIWLPQRWCSLDLAIEVMLFVALLSGSSSTLQSGF